MRALLFQPGRKFSPVLPAAAQPRAPWRQRRHIGCGHGENIRRRRSTSPSPPTPKAKLTSPTASRTGKQRRPSRNKRQRYRRPTVAPTSRAWSAWPGARRRTPTAKRTRENPALASKKARRASECNEAVTGRQRPPPGRERGCRRKKRRASGNRRRAPPTARRGGRGKPDRESGPPLTVATPFRKVRPWMGGVNFRTKQGHSSSAASPTNAAQRDLRTSVRSVACGRASDRTTSRLRQPKRESGANPRLTVATHLRKVRPWMGGVNARTEQKYSNRAGIRSMQRRRTCAQQQGEEREGAPRPTSPLAKSSGRAGARTWRRVADA